MAVLSLCFFYKEEQKRRVANKDKRGYKNATQHRCVALRRGGENCLGIYDFPNGSLSIPLFLCLT